MIEKAQQSDSEAIYKLLCMLENQTLEREHFFKSYQYGLNQPNILYLVYKDNDKVVGFMNFHIHHYLHHNKDTGEIIELIVDENYRGKNIGQQFLCYADKLAKDYNLEQIDLSTSVYRKRAHHFYENHGYKKSHYNYTKDY